MVAALYIRVSTDEQAEQGFSIDVQKERLIAFAKSQGWDDYALYIDDGYTGTKLDRPAMKRMIRHIEEGKISVVCVYKLDRLGRKQKDVLYLLEDVFEKHNVAFKSSTEPFDTSTPFGKAMIGVLAVFAQLERDMIVERTTSGRRQKVSQGMWHGGRIAFGYNWNKEAKQLEIIPEQAQIVKEIYKRFLQGQTYLGIAEWARTRTKDRFFDHMVIREMLTRPIYMGKLTNAGKLVKGNHEAIIDEDTWYMVQREVKRRKESYTPWGDYLLTGLLQCGLCSGGIVHVKRITKRNNKTYYYELYACKNQHVRRKERTNDCSNKYFQRPKIEEYVIEQLKSVSISQKKFQEVMDKKTEQSPDNELTIKALREKLEKINTGIENLYDAIQSGEIKASAVSGRISKLEEEREAVERQLDDLIEENVSKEDASKVFYLIKDISQTWDLLTLEEQKALLHRIINKIILNPDGRHEIVWNIAQ